MKTNVIGACALFAGIGAAAFFAGVTSAQNQREPAAQAARPPASLSLPTGRFGRTLGLPKDGKDLFIPDEEYIRFPLPPGNEAYADVDAMKIKATILKITASRRRATMTATNIGAASRARLTIA